MAVHLANGFPVGCCGKLSSSGEDDVFKIFVSKNGKIYSAFEAFA
jgi:hypothetical protein